jgi:hypothetical protein
MRTGSGFVTAAIFKFELMEFAAPLYTPVAGDGYPYAEKSIAIARTARRPYK